MKITLNEDERYYLAGALRHAIKRVDQHAEKVYNLPDGGGAYDLTMRDADWLRALLACVAKKPAEFQQEIARLQAVIDSLRQEVREQRREIAGLREERRAILDADRPRVDNALGG